MAELKHVKKERDPSRDRQVWYLAGPFYQYNEDVKELAVKAGLRIIDATATDERTNEAPADRIPKVTLRADNDKKSAKAGDEPSNKDDKVSKTK